MKVTFTSHANFIQLSIFLLEDNIKNYVFDKDMKDTISLDLDLLIMMAFDFPVLFLYLIQFKSIKKLRDFKLISSTNFLTSYEKKDL